MPNTFSQAMRSIGTSENANTKEPSATSTIFFSDALLAVLICRTPRWRETPDPAPAPVRPAATRYAARAPVRGAGDQSDRPGRALSPSAGLRPLAQVHTRPVAPVQPRRGG